MNGDRVTWGSHSDKVELSVFQIEQMASEVCAAGVNEMTKEYLALLEGFIRLCEATDEEDKRWRLMMLEGAVRKALCTEGEDL